MQELRITHLVTEVVNEDGTNAWIDEVTREETQAVALVTSSVVREQMRLSPAGDVLAVLRAAGMTENQIDSIVINIANNVIGGLQ